MIRPDGRLTLRKGTSSSNSPVLTFIPRSFSLNRWHGRRTLRDRCQEKEWKRTDGKSPRSCQCRRASANEKAAQSAGLKKAVLENAVIPPAFLFIFWLCADWYDESQRSAHSLISIHIPRLLSSTLPTKKALWFSVFYFYDTRPLGTCDNNKKLYFKQSTSLRTKTLHGHLLDWDADM